MVGIDLLVIVGAYLVTLVIRFEGRIPPKFWQSFWLIIPAIVIVHLTANFLFGLYGQMWRYASVQEARRVVLAGVFAGAIVVVLAELGSTPNRAIPLSVAFFGATLSFVGFGAVRFQSRLFGFRRRTEHDEPTRVLVVGAGDAGSMIVRDVFRNPAVGLLPVGFVDDDPKKIGLSLSGIRVEGNCRAIPDIARRTQADQVLLAIPSATSDLVRDVAAGCEKAGLMLRVLPSVREVVGGRVTAHDIRDLSIEDLLGRQQVEMEDETVRLMLEGRRVLITGAGGSIGSEIARQVASFAPARVTLLDHDETHLHDVMSELESSPIMSGVLADVRDRDRVHEVMRSERPEVVFHAAAHKHVPLLEDHPAEAFRTNVLGTANVAEAAAAIGVDHFVLVSTDKAVRPASVMGASKWFAEQVVRSLQNGGGGVFCAVRFGNVLGSRGSVVPTFLRQIRSGGPLTVTDPSMARFFMSIQEAVCLVLQSAAMSRGGEVFTLEMGEPVNILDLAGRLVRLSGRVPGRDVKIEVVGRRPGEKLVEDLIDPDEDPGPSGHQGIMVSRPRTPDRAALKRALRELDLLVDESDALADRMKDLAAAGFVEDVVRI
ncbi:MAG TPA: nucleoside-diphosphate sugar epimerase/dehydratase [Actinomycetota bacterium]